MNKRLEIVSGRLRPATNPAEVARRKEARGKRKIPSGVNDSVRPDIVMPLPMHEKVQLLAAYWDCTWSEVVRWILDHELPAYLAAMEEDAKDYWEAKSSPKD